MTSPVEGVSKLKSEPTRPLVDLELAFRPQPEVIYALCEMVSRLCTPHVTDLDVVSRIRLATHELLENLVKYAVDGSASFSLRIQDVPLGRSIRLETANRASVQSVNDLRARLDALTLATDPIAHYDAVIMESLRRSSGSGLGLARIRAEGEMRLYYAIEADRVLIVSETIISAKGSPMLDLAAVKTPEFACVSTYDDGALHVEFSGKGDMNAIAALGDYLKQVHSEATRLHVAEVVCDFQRLSFMNSSCFKAFVVWIDTVKNLPSPYRIRFLTDHALHWQRRSLEALRRLASDVVSVESKGE
jgi:hypothetical protein